MPLGLIDGRPFRPFSRAISSRCAATITFRSETSPSSSTTRASSSARGRPDGSEGVDMQRANRTRPRRGKLKNRRCPGFCPYYDADIQRHLVSNSPRSGGTGATRSRRLGASMARTHDLTGLSTAPCSDKEGHLIVFTPGSESASQVETIVVEDRKLVHRLLPVVR